MTQYKDVFMRSEIKYLLSAEQYFSLRRALLPMAEVDAYGLSRINNIYFDTPDYRLIRTSLEKPVYKEKLRLRTYGDHTEDDTNSFIEIKKKYDGVVYKRRIAGPYADTYAYLTGQGQKPESSQIAGEIEQTLRYYQGLRPAMLVCYERIAMVGRQDPTLRITFDRNISYNEDCIDLRRADPKSCKPILKKDHYLMEIKVSNSLPMELARKLSELSIFPVSFSKYGLGYLDMLQNRQTAMPDVSFTENNILTYPLASGMDPAYTLDLEQTGRQTRRGVAAYV